MKTRYYTAILLASFTILVGCSKGDDPKPDGSEGEIWYPEKSQPGVFKVPDGLKNHQDTYAKQTYSKIEVLDKLIKDYAPYFIAPQGTKNTSITPTLGNRFEYAVNNHTVNYMYGDFSSTHRIFELEVDNSNTPMFKAGGDLWENWNAEDGKPEQGKHYGNVSYYIGSDDTRQTKEFSWIDDGGGRYRVKLLIWSTRPNSYLTARYEYTFKPDLSGNYTYWSYPPNGGGDYWRADWKASGKGALTKGEGGAAVTYQW
ncbi:hypothetical protein FAZ15_03580 [Sphingobacterium olei]|uniref:Uncharacterized protein n=1 Tax=Sphingobacterium olei TaxID=2571155 RepID=A0A4U0P7D1_9SPHI|nr:hypothetical protein [Sphingobacterium olei]TJZ63373.1 hypothetical protein FAZ15_03580 [Sphingobacterium olei]